MILHSNLFKNVCQAAGATGFWGEGYRPVDTLLRFVPGYSWKGTELTTKTVTVRPTTGNMPLRENGTTPKEWLPECVYFNPRKRVMLNAVRLSNFGLKFYLHTGRWQSIAEPFRISFMPVAADRAGRAEECKTFVGIMKRYKIVRPFRAATAIQLNASCPNHLGGRNVWEPEEIVEYAKILSELGRPVEIKFGATYRAEDAAEISRSEYCAAVNGINTVPFGAFPDMIPWERLFGRKGEPLESPLMRRPKIGMPGGLSGPYIKPVALLWIEKVRAAGCRKPIFGGGGITCPRDVDDFERAGADGVSIGTIKFFAPWNMRRTIRHAVRVFREKEGAPAELHLDRAPLWIFPGME